MHSNHSSSRRRRGAPLAAEALETRQLLTGSAGNTFAIVPGEITKTGATAEIKFTIDPTHFTVPKRGMVLGIDVVATSGSTVKPKIVSVQNATTHAFTPVTHGTYDKNLPKQTLSNGPVTSAITTTIRKPAANQSVTYTVDVKGLGNTTGKFLLGFYLPGDANGDGTVDKTDATKINPALGANGTQSTYNFDADGNRDGKISVGDVAMYAKNIGAKTTITPVITADIDTSSDPKLVQRVTTNNWVKFSGTTSPSASVTFTETENKVAAVTAKADAAGKYTLTVPLAGGGNTFKVSSTDAFGQTISGTVAPVNYQTNTANSQTFTALKEQPVTVTKT